MGVFGGSVRFPLRFALLLYSLLSAAKLFFFGPTCRCRFHPTCSQYALECIRRHGALHSLQFIFRRLCRCHPWHCGGYDPVP
ncbi:MAG: membrane protein insertion efficiency factor YidD [Puniceicoccales bacterium]|nr:membrane protein insertion efficiency factor YidD [Puniceicoccales bacterium]